MSLAQKIRSMLGFHLLTSTAGFRVVRSDSGTGPWIKEGVNISLVPEGVQEVQFPVEVMGSDNITATAQVSVVFTYASTAEKFFNFAYSAEDSQHSGDFATSVKKLIMSIVSPKVTQALSQKTIGNMVKESTFSSSGMDCDGVEVKSVTLLVKPRDAQVLAALGATTTEELLRTANTARQGTRMQAVDEAASLRAAEHKQSLAGAAEAALLIEEVAKNKLAQASSEAAALKVLSSQKAEAQKAMVEAFSGDALACAINALATSGADVTVTTELLAALRSTK